MRSGSGAIEIEFAATSKVQMTGAVAGTTLGVVVATLDDGQPRWLPLRPPRGRGLRPAAPTCAANSPALPVLEALRRDPHGDVFRGKSCKLIKARGWGMSFDAKRL